MIKSHLRSVLLSVGKKILGALLLLDLIEYLRQILFVESVGFGQIDKLFVAGGVVLQVLAAVAFVLFCLLFNRLWFKFFEYPNLLKKCRRSISAQQFSLLVYDVRRDLQRSMSLIKTAINVCPLLGLIGTVVGMIDIFDVIATNGISNAQIMSGGVARAILPTMAGMVIAISAMFVFAYIQRWVARQQRILMQISLSWNTH